MDDRMRAMAETAARLLLQSFRGEHPEWTDDRTPLDEVVAWLGLHIGMFHPDDYPEGTFGFMDPDEDEQLIWLRRGLPEPFLRFTLAHELGHAVMHCHRSDRVQALPGTLHTLLASQEQSIPGLSSKDPCHGTDVQEEMTGLLDHEQFQEALGIGQTYDPRSQRELAANIFAAELLMPLERVCTLYLTERVPPTTLSGIFGVSNAAMLNRLAGLLKQPASALTSDPVGDHQPLPSPTHGHPQEVPLRDERSPKKHYDEFQQAAIEAPTPALIVAGPGSGKTSTLVGRAEYMVRTLGIQPQHILALTFSRKAAQEMEERLRQALDSDTGDTNGTISALPRVSTFHAFCADLLRQHGALVGLRSDFTLIDEAEGYFLLRQLANEIRLHHYQNLHAPAYYFPDMLKAISRAKDELVSPQAYAQLAQRMKEQAHDEETLQKAEKALEVAHVYALYQETLQQRGDTDFGSLLMLAVQLLQQHSGVLQEQQQRYQHILVDEFQDMNRASGVLLRVLAGDERRVWVVGDANQAIYGFRGASPANISQFETDFSGAVVLPLSRNYRSRPDLVAIAESFRCKQLEFGQEPGKNQPVRLTQPDTYVTLAKVADEASELHGLIQDMRSKHAQGYAYKDMVVLCRTRAQAQKISRTLAKAGLPVIERGGMLEQEYIKDVLSIVLLLTDPGGMGILRAARQPGHPFAQADIEILLLAARDQKITPGMLIFNGEAPSNMSIQGRTSLTHLSELLQKVQHAPNAWSLLAQYLLIETTLVRDLLCSQDSKQSSTILNDYDGLLQLARHYDQQQLRATQKAQELAVEAKEDGGHAGQTTTQPLLQEQLKGFLEYLGLLVLLRQDGGNRQQTEGEDAESADIIRVLTVHASKGLEFPVVYLPGLVQRRFPLQRRSSPITAPAGMLPPESEGNAAHESGESCLFYVGVTRARDHLVLSYSERYGKVSYKRSPYLDALEASDTRINKLQWEKGPTGEQAGRPQGIAPTMTRGGPDRVIVGADPCGRPVGGDTCSAIPCGRPVGGGTGGTGDGNQHGTHTPTLSTSQLSDNFINAMKPMMLSASAIEAYQRCPRQYAYSNIYHFESEEDGYLLFWQATQRTVEALRQQMQETQKAQGGEAKAGQAPTQEEIQELYTQYWQALGGHTAPFAPMYEQHGHEVVESIRRELTTKGDVTWDLRPDFTVGVAGKTVHVTVDRVEASAQTGAPVKFVRTRFGKRKEKPPTETRELLYTLAYRQHHPGQSVKLHSHNMSTGEVVPITMTAKKEQSLYDEVEQSILAMERNEYPAQPAEPFRCPMCPFFMICPA